MDDGGRDLDTMVMLLGRDFLLYSFVNFVKKSINWRCLTIYDAEKDKQEEDSQSSDAGNHGVKSAGRWKLSAEPTGTILRTWWRYGDCGWVIAALRDRLTGLLIMSICTVFGRERFSSLDFVVGTTAHAIYLKRAHKDNQGQAFSSV